MSNLRPLTISLLGGLRRAGRFAIGARATLVTLIGGMDLDLTEAEMPREGVTLTKVSLIGGVRVAVPNGVRVEVSRFVLIGGRHVERDPNVPADAPVLRVRAFGLIGGVAVRTAAGSWRARAHPPG
jgi:hypothetical protein